MNEYPQKIRIGDILKAINDIFTRGTDISTIYISKGYFYKIVNITDKNNYLRIHILDLHNDVKEIYSHELNNFINLEEHRDKIINNLLNGKQ